jgi:hypothetical protein
VGEGDFTNDKLDTFGGYGVLKVPNLQTLLQYVCRMGFEHHVAANKCQKADAIAEALDNYMGWEVAANKCQKADAIAEALDNYMGWEVYRHA